MKAGIFYGTGNVGVEEIEKPVPGPNDVVVRVLRGGICGSDIFAFRDNDRLTCVNQKGENGADGTFGHELCGIIDTLGENVTGIEVGDRVFVNPNTARRKGLADSLGGAFSEYMYVEDAKYGYNLQKWDDSVSNDHAALLEPMCVATHGKNQARVTSEDNVLILGGGAIGLCALAACLNAGCKNVVVVDLFENRLEAARKMGGKGFNSKTDGDMAEYLKKEFGIHTTFFGVPFPDIDAVIDCAGAAVLLDQVLHMAKDKMRVAIIAGYAAPYSMDLSFFGSMQVEMHGSRGFEQKDVEEAFANISSGKINIDPIITHHFKLDDIKDAFATANDPTRGAIKILIDVAEK